MHRKLSGRAILAAATLTFSCALSAAWPAAPAQAASGSSDCQSSGGSSGGGGGSDGDYKLWVAVNSQIPSCAGGGNASQSDGTGGGVSVHVPCWWGEEYDPAGLEGYIQGFEATSSTDNWYMILAAEYDKNGTDPFTAGYTSDAGPPWESYNVGSSPAGEWYGLILNNGDTSDQLTACTDEEDARAPEMFYWGDDGDPPADLPTNAPGFTAEDLAKYVESVVQLPRPRC